MRLPYATETSPFSNANKLFDDGQIALLQNLNKSVRGKVKQYNRMINVLWYCNLISDSETQPEVADMLGISDSLIFDYRKRFSRKAPCSGAFF